MKVAECRVKDPNCSFSRGLASVTVGAIKAGKTETAAIAESKASKFGTRPAPKLLDDPVPIPTLGSPVMGPANAPHHAGGIFRLPVPLLFQSSDAD